MGLISWFKGKVSNLFHKRDIESALKIDIVHSERMERALNLWTAMYEDRPPWKNKTTPTLNIPAVIASKFGKMVTIESTIKAEGSTRADYINEQLTPIISDLRNVVEFACAKGGMMFKPYISGNHVIIDKVHAGRFFPTSTDSNGEITGCVFVAQKTIGDVTYTRLEHHLFKDGQCTIKNEVFKSNIESVLGSLCNLSDVPEWKNLQPITTIQNLARPLFTYFRMPFANNIDQDSPLGVSVFARASETIMQLDKQYGRLLWEFEGGELAIHASADVFQHKENGGPWDVVLPEGKERLYRVADGMSEDESFFQAFAIPYRDVSILNGLNAVLRHIEQQSNLAFGTLSDPQSVDKTATEVIHNKQESYTTVSDIQKSLEKALNELVLSIDALATAGNLTPAGTVKLSCGWDDSVITDKESKRQRVMQLVLSNKFPMWRYLVLYEGFSEKDAKEIEAETKIDMNDPFQFGES